MALINMKRLVAIAPAPMRREALRELYRLGCVELESASPQLLEESQGLLRPREENTGAADVRTRLTAAAEALDRYAPCKTPLLAPRRPLTERQLFEPARLARAVEAAGEITALVSAIEGFTAEQHRLSGRIAALRPWEPLDVPLEQQGGALTVFLRGVLPASVDFFALQSRLAEAVPATQLDLISSDTEQHYITLLVCREDEEEAVGLLKSHGYMAAHFKDVTGTALENTAAMAADISRLDGEISAQIQRIGALATERDGIRLAIDAYTQEVGKDALLSSVGQTSQTVLLTGWVPAPAVDHVGGALSVLGCAYEFTDPGPGDSPPTATSSGRLVDPFTGVTAMYGTPAYGSIIDPNPLMSIFYFTFFGFMLGDAVYGILMFFGCMAYLRFKRPAGSMRRMITLFAYCGVASFFVGILTGSWLADAASAISLWLTGTAVAIPPLWFDPLSEPMTMMVLSLALGAVQMVVGMALSAWRMIRQGRPLDALFDIGSWYIVFIGVALLALGIPAGPPLALVGVAMLLLTGGRHNKGLGKITGGLGALYGVTGYVSDLLSYSRIMALGLSGAVVGQVINKIATMGSGILGFVLFVSVFLFGHVFNLAISLLGAYVHSSRLQYIEFFGRFFEDGGRPFRPLENNTKFVEIIKED